MDTEIAGEADENRATGVDSFAMAHQRAGHPIDLQHLRRYTLGDRALEEEVLGLFIEQLPKTLASLKAAETAKDWYIASHTLKGSGRAVGAWRVAECAEEAEKIKAFSNTANRHRALKALEEAVIEARNYIVQLAGTH